MGTKKILSIVATLSLFLVASIAPGMAWAGPKGGQGTLSPPYSDASTHSSQFCGGFSGSQIEGDAEGDATCYDLASSANPNTGLLSETAKTSTESPTDPTGLTG